MQATQDSPNHFAAERQLDTSANKRANDTLMVLVNTAIKPIACQYDELYRNRKRPLSVRSCNHSNKADSTDRGSFSCKLKEKTTRNNEMQQVFPVSG